MVWLLLACFGVGCIVVALFTEGGRGCLGALLVIMIMCVGVTALGGAVLFGLIYLIVELTKP